MPDQHITTDLTEAIGFTLEQAAKARRMGFRELARQLEELSAMPQAVLDPENQPSQFGTVTLAHAQQCVKDAEARVAARRLEWDEYHPAYRAGTKDGFRAGWRAAIEAAAQDVDCACNVRDVVLSVPPNSSRRWEACGHPECGALTAASIRALEPPAAKREPTGLEERGA